LVFTNAQALLGTTLAYWDYLARVRRLEIARDAEQRAMRLVEEIKKLIRDDQVPAADIQLVSASYAERLAARIGAEQTLTEGRRALALQIGLSPERAAEMPLPMNEFPAFDEQAAHVDTKIAVLREDAIGRRADLEAARQREQSARRRLIAARSGLKPQLDVSLGVNYTSLVENRVPFAVGNVMGTNPAGPSILATLAAQLPARNSAAEGTFLAASAGLDASSIRVNSLMDTIGNNVSASALGLARAALQLVQSIETTRYYRLSVENERTKRRLGLATLIDVINVEDRLTNALLAEVQARQSYASAIAQLRFEVGTLVVRRDDRFDVDVDSLFNPRFDTTH
ncbi:MAG TPA: TolC family protein, partial [Burkholderiales bacterium]|nr:TolC family protein [Burkholderiales bacterium]